MLVGVVVRGEHEVLACAALAVFGVYEEAHGNDEPGEVISLVVIEPENGRIVVRACVDQRYLADHNIVVEGSPSGKFAWRGDPALWVCDAFDGVTVLGVHSHEDGCQCRNVRGLAGSDLDVH